jgi:hypothetical protein
VAVFFHLFFREVYNHLRDKKTLSASRVIAIVLRCFLATSNWVLGYERCKVYGYNEGYRKLDDGGGA